MGDFFELFFSCNAKSFLLNFFLVNVYLNSLDKGGVCDLLGISVCGDYETWKYYIAVATSETAKFEFEKLIIPASKWAIFSGKGTNVSFK